MLRFIRTFVIKLGTAYLLSYSGCVFLGSMNQLLLCILLITISTYIAEFISNCFDDFVNNSIYGLFMSTNNRMQLIIGSIVICLIFLIVIPIIIINYTSGMQILYDNIFIKLVVVCILWIIGFIPKRNEIIGLV